MAQDQFDKCEPDLRGSVTILLSDLKKRDGEAAAKLWNRYMSRVAAVARVKLKGFPAHIEDEDDVLTSVFDKLFRAVENNKFAKLDDRTDLWQILMLLTERKIRTEYRRATTKKSGGGTVRREADLQSNSIGRPTLAELRVIVDSELPPEVGIVLRESVSLALDKLKNEKTRRVAILTMEGYTTTETAEELGCSKRSVERKLQVVREIWNEFFPENSSDG